MCRSGGGLETVRALVHPLVEEIAAQRPQVGEQPAADHEVLSERFQLVVHETERVEMPGAREGAWLGNFLHNRALRVVERLAEQPDVLVRALDTVERGRRVRHGSRRYRANGV